MLGFDMRMIQTIRQDFSETIFHEAEAILNDTEGQKALKFVGRSKMMDNYTTMMDFLFCEVAGPPWPGRCRAFYDGNEKMLKDWLTPDEILYWDKVLCVAMAHALYCLKIERSLTWTKFRVEVRKLCA